MSNKSRIENNLIKNQQLINIIDGMSKSDIDNATTIEKLKDIYSEDFRHSYSMISKKLHDMDSDERDIVSEGMSQLVDGLIEYEKSGSSIDGIEGLVKGITKLNDHINLEIIRIQLDTQADEKLRDAVIRAETIKENTSYLETNVNDLNSEIWDLKNQAESSNTQSITILSIFAGIVFVFTGGFSLISTALQNINSASVYKMTYTLSLVGMLIYNLIFLFFYMIAKVTGKDISAGCLKTSQHYCSNDEKPCESCKGPKKFFRKFWYTLVPNIFFILVMLVAVIAWLIRH